MFNVKFSLCVVLVFIGQALSPITVAAEVEAKEIYFGSVAMDVPAVMHSRLLSKACKDSASPRRSIHRLRSCERCRLQRGSQAD